MTDEEVEITEDTLSACSSYCEHCEHYDYAMCWDFICDIDDDVPIVDWKPFPCHHPERRKLVDDTTDEDD